MSRRQLLLREGNFLIDGAFQLCDVRISGSTIKEIGTQIHPLKDEMVISLDGLHVIPGLINSHDHLEFNLFPRLGHPPYNNYVEWANDIQDLHQREIQRVLQVPLKYRLLWGAFKNIFSGVTTVVHHNRYYWQFRFRYPVEVFRNYRWIHSLRLEKRNIKKLVSADSKPCFIHLAEGIDEIAGGEFEELALLGGVTNHTVIVHGIGLNDKDIEALIALGAGLVWCPSSNTYLFGRTAPIEKMLRKMPIALGTDSTLTGSQNMFDELRVAKASKRLSSKVVVDLVTSSPAKLLHSNKGIIQNGASADFVFFEKQTTDPFDSVLSLRPFSVKCVMKNALPVFGDVSLEWALQVRSSPFATLELEGRKKFVPADFFAIRSRIRQSLPEIGLPA